MQTIAAGLYHCGILDSSGNVWIFGIDKGEEFVQLIQGEYTTLTAAENISHMIDSKGDVWTIGTRYSVMMGINKTLFRPLEPCRISSLHNIIEISTSDTHTLALEDDGTVWGCGDNSFGQLGCESKPQISFIKIVGFPFITHVSSGHGHSLVLDNSNILWGCGAGEGFGGDLEYSTPQEVGNIFDIKKIVAGFKCSFVLTKNGSIYGIGKIKYNDLYQQEQSFVKIENLPSNYIVDIGCCSFGLFIVDSDGLLYGKPFYDEKSPVGLQNLNEFSKLEVSSISGISAFDNYILMFDRNGEVSGLGTNKGETYSSSMYSNSPILIPNIPSAAIPFSTQKNARR